MEMAGERHGRGMGTEWTRHAMCELALRLQIENHNMIYIYRFPTAAVFIRTVSNLRYNLHWLSFCEIGM
jgi:hypothetical protein